MYLLEKREMKKWARQFGYMSRNPNPITQKTGVTSKGRFHCYNSFYRHNNDHTIFFFKNKNKIK